MTAYPALRRLLVHGAPPAPNDREAVAQAAREGEVVVLALRADPSLAPWLAGPARKQMIIDAALEQALAVAAESLGSQASVVLLKGSATARLIYPDTAARFRRDVDLLVADLPTTRARLLAAGFVDRADPVRAAQGPAVARAWPMGWAAPFGEVELDLHRTILAFPWCRLDPAALLAHAVPSTPLPLTDALDTAIHTAVHLVDNGLRQPLKAWVDLARLVPTLEPDALAARAARYHTRAALWATLHVTARWFELDLGRYLRALPRPRHHVLITRALAADGAHPHRHPSRARARDLLRLLLADTFRARVAYLRSRIA